MDFSLLLQLLAAVMTVAGLTLAVMIFRRLRRLGPPVAISDARMSEAWMRWMDGGELSDNERVLRAEFFRLLDERTMHAVRDDLLALESATAAERFPLTAIRKELMASVDRRMLNTEILRLPEELKRRLRAQSADLLQTDAETQTYIAANELRLAVLRDYAALRYGDKSPGDWFAVYQKASRLKQRSARSFIEKSLAGDPDAPSDARHHAMTLVDHELRARLLKVPPGTRFPGFADSAPPDTIQTPV
jgi:hypothetical protein